MIKTASSAGGMGSIPGQGTKIPCATRLHQRREKKQGNKSPQNFNGLKQKSMKTLGHDLL